jgi:O-acetyl-ADP-ribose deacetylase (regulator of RNase III)
MRPRVFVGSSKERLSLAYAIQECLAHDADVTVWTQGVFLLSESSLESLLAFLDRVDYGVFVLAPDDLVTMRGRRAGAARDNVVFELGLFMGRLGRGAGFIVAPEGHGLRVPTDLLGTTPALYDPARAEQEPAAALGPACNQIRQALGHPAAGSVVRLENGYRLLLSPGRSIDLVFEPIQKARPDWECGAVVLPANRSFDDACVRDGKSALGAYFQTHFPKHIAEVQSLVSAQLGTQDPDSLSEGGYPPGTVVYLDRPLGTPNRVILAAVTEKVAGAGIQADTLSLIASLKSVMRLAVDRRLTKLWMPIMGTGHGGLDFSVALTMIIVQLSNCILREGYHSIQRFVLTVHDPDGRRAEQVERVVKAFPLLVRT